MRPKPMANLSKEDVHLIKKPALNFDFIKPEVNNSPRLGSYFGGKPYIMSHEEIRVCPDCKNKMDFVCQFLIPDKQTKINSLFALYYCFACVQNGNEGEAGTFSVNVYRDPKIEKMITDLEYESNIPYRELRFLPTYEIPEWDLLGNIYPAVQQKFINNYGDNAVDAYAEIQDKVKEYYLDTGYKLRGYAESFPYEETPRCKETGELMEPFLQLECVPEMNMNWTAGNSYLILFKSKKYDEFILRCLEFEEEEEMEMDEDDLE